MGRREDRQKGRDFQKFVVREAFSKYSNIFNSIGSNYSNLKNNLVSDGVLSDCILKYKGKEYNLVPILCIFFEMSTLDKEYSTYLGSYLSSVYNNYFVTNDINSIMSTTLNAFNYISITEKSSLNALMYNQLVSMCILNDKLDECIKVVYSKIGKNSYLNLLGLNLLLNSRYAVNIEENKCLITDSILNVYEVLNTVSKALRCEGADVVKFARVCLSYFIESNSIGGATFDLEDELLSLGEDYSDMLKYIDLSYIDTLDDIDDVKNKIKYLNGYLLPNYMNSFTLVFAQTVNKVKKENISEVQELKNKYAKERQGYERNIKLLNRDLKVANKKISKLESSLDKANSVNKVSKEEEYKRVIEELTLKNKQLESKLEGSNICINNLQCKLSCLKEQVDTLSKKESLLTNELSKYTTNIVNTTVDLDTHINTMVDALNDLNIVIVGGTDTAYNRISSYLPNSKYIDADTSPNFDIPLNTDYVVLCTRILSHSHTRRAEVFENSVRGILKINKTNPEEIIKDIYNTVIG